MSQNNEKKKSRFEINREVQEEFVNSVAEQMHNLASKAGQWQKPWHDQKPVGMPFCAVNGREYGGANMVKLMLSTILNGHNDDRWMTFKQLQAFQGDNPELQMQIRKGEKGVKLLRPEEIKFTVDEKTGRWNYLNDKQVEELRLQKELGLVVPDVQRMTLFYPFTVFNAAQIDGFPQKEHQAQALSVIERNALVEDFIASSGVIVRHHLGDAFYDPKDDTVKMPLPQNFKSTDEYYATKLHEFYHATGRKFRENREDNLGSGKSYALEEIRAEMFSMLVGARFNLPMPEQNSAAYINHWNQQFSGGDVKAILQATSDAAKMLSVMHQYEMGEQPKAKWFPQRVDWPFFKEEQKKRDKVSGAQLHEMGHHMAVKNVQAPAQPRYGQAQEWPPHQNNASTFKAEQRNYNRPTNVPSPENVNAAMPRSPQPNFKQSVAAYKSTDETIMQFRAILQNPEMLELAMKGSDMDSRSLAQLCDAFSTTLHLELDARQQEGQRAEQGAEQQTTQQPRTSIRMRG